MLQVDKTVSLSLIENSRGRTVDSRKQRLVDISRFPDEPGAYVLRYTRHKVGRLIGESSVLKIGSASGSLRDRFKNYNHQKDVTTVGTDLAALLSVRSQKTNVRLMHFLAHHNHPCELVVDLYLQSSAEKDPVTVESMLLQNYLAEHGELPPLNYGTR